jgi:hypothetical protein
MMSVASQAAAPLASINNETMGGLGIGIMVAVIVISLAVMLLLLFRASLHPGTKRRNPQVPLTGPVMGGMHVGAGRSVAPNRNEAAGPRPGEPGSPAAAGGSGGEPSRHDVGAPRERELSSSGSGYRRPS